MIPMMMITKMMVAIVMSMDLDHRDNHEDSILVLMVKTNMRMAMEIITVSMGSKNMSDIFAKSKMASLAHSFLHPFLPFKSPLPPSLPPSQTRELSFHSCHSASSTTLQHLLDLKV